MRFMNLFGGALACALLALPANAATNLSWSLDAGQLGPGLEYGSILLGSTWKTSGQIIKKPEVVNFTSTGVQISSRGQNDFGFGTYFPLSGAYMVSVDVRLSSLKGLAGIIFDDYPDVFMYPNGVVVTGSRASDFHVKSVA
jgi:hypothetical protein